MFEKGTNEDGDCGGGGHLDDCDKETGPHFYFYFIFSNNVVACRRGMWGIATGTAMSL